jgi:pimeloyl-ACP methyl ester carboxylesterase
MNFDHCSGKHLEIDGASIYYEVTGDENGPTLLALHGGFGNLTEFNSILPKLSREFKIIGIDSRGQGKSTLGSHGLTYQRLQKDVEGVLEHLNIDAVSIIGFSDGGIIAYRLASLTTLNIEKLVTIGSRWHSKYLAQVWEILSGVTGDSWRKKFPDTYDAYQKQNPEPDFASLAKAIVAMWLDSNPSGYPNEAVRSISCPLLVVRGDDDHLVPREAVVELCGVVENSTLLNIPFAGHVAFEDQNEIFMTILNKFLEQS